MPVDIGKQEIYDNLIIQKSMHCILSQPPSLALVMNCSKKGVFCQGFTANQVPCGNELQSIGSKAGSCACKPATVFLLYQCIRHIAGALLRCMNSCRKHLIQALLNRKPYTIFYEVAYPPLLITHFFGRSPPVEAEGGKELNWVASCNTEKPSLKLLENKLTSSHCKELSSGLTQ